MGVASASVDSCSYDPVGRAPSAQVCRTRTREPLWGCCVGAVSLTQLGISRPGYNDTWHHDGISVAQTQKGPPSQCESDPVWWSGA
jgi:hypothetical protein